MKIKIPTKSATSLQKIIFDAVKNETLKTWAIRIDGQGITYLTHKPDQWYDKALLSFSPKTDSLEISTNYWQGKKPGEDVDGYYIGRFTEVLLVHFSTYYETFEIHK